jgi:hypothetical protein
VYRAGALGQKDGLLFRREVVVGTGYGAGAPPTIHVGLGTVDRVDVRVTLRSGAVLEGRNVSAGRRLSSTSDLASA